jgi:hypothetical protein
MNSVSVWRAYVEAYCNLSEKLQVKSEDAYTDLPVCAYQMKSVSQGKDVSLEPLSFAVLKSVGSYRFYATGMWLQKMLKRA